MKKNPPFANGAKSGAPGTAEAARERKDKRRHFKFEI
jgi:hypothetical protein